MAISWGPVAKHLFVGLEGFITPSTLTPSDTTARIDVDYWLSSYAWGFSDNQVAVLTGAISDTIAYTMSAPSGSTTAQYLGRRTLTGIPTSLVSTTVRSFGCEITGIYAGAGSGANPYHAIAVTIPIRPPGLWVRTGGAWVAVVATKIRTAGTWQPILRWWGKISGTFK